jgi:hypothetical protein
MCVGSHLAVYRKCKSLVHQLPTSKPDLYATEKLASRRANALTEMKYIVATLYSNYSTTIIEDTGIEQSDSYTAPPKSDKLIIKLERLEV